MEQKKKQWATDWRMFAWVPDGVYDFQTFGIRYVVSDGMPEVVITKMWLDQGGPPDVPKELLVPWGTYPDFPPKPAK